MIDVKTIEAKHIFIDIVNYTHNRSVEAQTDLISFLNEFVVQALEKSNISIDNKIYIPTGDGMCISLINISTPFDIHILIALDILERIYSHNSSTDDEMRKFDIRIGINENIDNLIIDINGNKNISGSGINHAARIEGLCDANQILVGNSVFEKLVQREKYMKSFTTYSTEVKHGLLLKVHQYKNKNIEYLNSDVPSRFKPTPTKTFRLSELQAFYLANCIVNEEFISKNLGIGQHQFSLHTLLVQLSMDCYEKTKVTKVKPVPTTKVNRELQEHFDYFQSIDFWIICDLSQLFAKEYLSEISNYFSEAYLFTNEKGRKKLQEDHPIICEQMKIE